MIFLSIVQYIGCYLWLTDSESMDDPVKNYTQLMLVKEYDKWIKKMED